MMALNIAPVVYTNIDNTNKDTFQSYFQCHNGQMLGLSLVNDLVPDCVGGEDENLLSELALGLKDPNKCMDAAYLPCYPGHSRCFALHSLCKYASDDNGHLRYCRNGAHLRDCTFFQCSGLFKRPLSYCVPLKMMCDNIIDCPNGEDEMNCDINITHTGLLLCKDGGYVHPVQVCDNEIDCRHGDDEKLCGLTTCPETCKCFGLAMVCPDHIPRYISLINLVHYKSFSGKLNNDGPYLDKVESIVQLNISGSQLKQYLRPILWKMKSVIYLDLSACMLINRCLCSLSSPELLRPV